jgi:hypothetical protein
MIRKRSTRAFARTVPTGSVVTPPRNDETSRVGGPGSVMSGGDRLGLPGRIRACLFDLDGVLTETASVHAAAWTETFDAHVA